MYPEFLLSFPFSQKVFSRGSRSFCDACSKICSPPPWQQEGRKPSDVLSQHQTPVHAQPTQQPYHTKEEMEIGRREEDMHFDTETPVDPSEWPKY